MNALRCDPEPDCKACNGTGLDHGARCECTRVCDCGEERPNNRHSCASCGTWGCDSCGEVDWCGAPYDDSDGDYFCRECRSEAAAEQEADDES